MAKLALGKIPAPLLSKVLEGHAPKDPRIRIGPSVGEDAAVLEFSDRLLVAKSDPITFASERIPWYAVHVNANDVACMGARPRWFLATVLFPEGIEEGEVEAFFQELRDVLEAMDIELIGGHTEVTAGLDRPILSGTMLGETSSELLVDNRRIEEEDDLILVKGLAIEGTAILATEMREELSSRFSESWIEEAQSFLDRPGISILEPARRVLELGVPHAMHDPTEGGMIGAARELASLNQLGLRIFADHVHVYPETEALCAEFGLDPFGLLASGALLVATSPEDTDLVLQGVRDGDHEAFVIGKFLPPSEGLTLVEDGETSELPHFEADELTKILG